MRLRRRSTIKQRNTTLVFSKRRLRVLKRRKRVVVAVVVAKVSRYDEQVTAPLFSSASPQQVNQLFSILLRTQQAKLQHTRSPHSRASQGFLNTNTHKYKFLTFPALSLVQQVVVVVVKKYSPQCAAPTWRSFFLTRYASTNFL